MPTRWKAAHGGTTRATQYPESLVGETGFEALLVNFAFCPDEGLGGFVIVGDEILDMGDEFWNALERGSVERLSREDREPDFDLVEPGSVRRGEVEMHHAYPVRCHGSMAGCDRHLSLLFGAFQQARPW